MSIPASQPMPVTGAQSAEFDTSSLAANSSSCGTEPTSPALHALTDIERERAIEHAGNLIRRHMGEWERTGCFAARGQADYARQYMERLIKGRSPQQIERMERQQRERMLLEPGATRNPE